jgi:hypothetical protein
VDDDVDPVEAIKKLTDNLCRSLGCRDIRLDEMSPRFLFGGGSRRDDDGSSCEQKAISDGLAGAFRSPVTRTRLPLNSPVSLVDAVDAVIAVSPLL